MRPGHIHLLELMQLELQVREAQPLMEPELEKQVHVLGQGWEPGQQEEPGPEPQQQEPERYNNMSLNQ
jgi:hypothetical protein